VLFQNRIAARMTSLLDSKRPALICLAMKRSNARQMTLVFLDMENSARNVLDINTTLKDPKHSDFELVEPRVNREYPGGAFVQDRGVPCWTCFDSRGFVARTFAGDTSERSRHRPCRIPYPPEDRT